MKIAIIGSGIIGLALAFSLSKRYPKALIEIIDQFSIPSSGTSVRNSGVLHAGLYHRPESLKSKLCRSGSTQLLEFITENNLPLLNCGKILVPLCDSDYDRLYRIKSSADLNNCLTELINYSDASSIQPGICGRDQYLYSPNTRVFSPSHVLNTLASRLDKTRVKFTVSRVLSISSRDHLLVCSDYNRKGLDLIFNVAGPGSLALYKGDTGKLSNLELLPILGQYSELTSSPLIKTNIYPVPDPALPFLGIHVTPRPCDLPPIVGPNAVPILRENIQTRLSSDVTKLFSRLGALTALYVSNSANFRVHANSEFTFSLAHKFRSKAALYFQPSVAREIRVKPVKSTYGIRPQLIDMHKLSFFDDFICDKHFNTVHVVNAVSPAFTSAFALADLVISMVES